MYGFSQTEYLLQNKLRSQRCYSFNHPTLYLSLIHNCQVRPPEIFCTVALLYPLFYCWFWWITCWVRIILKLGSENQQKWSSWLLNFFIILKKHHKETRTEHHQHHSSSMMKIFQMPISYAKRHKNMVTLYSLDESRGGERQ